MRKHFFGFTLSAGLWLQAKLAMAQADVANVVIGNGEDKSKELSIIANIITTAQQILIWGIGPLIGTSLAVKGFRMMGQAERGEKGPAVLMIICGAALFALGPVIEQLLKLYK